MRFAAAVIVPLVVTTSAYIAVREYQPVSGTSSTDQDRESNVSDVVIAMEDLGLIEPGPVADTPTVGPSTSGEPNPGPSTDDSNGDDAGTPASGASIPGDVQEPAVPDTTPAPTTGDSSQTASSTSPSAPATSTPTQPPTTPTPEPTTRQSDPPVAPTESPTHRYTPTAKPTPPAPSPTDSSRRPHRPTPPPEPPKLTNAEKALLDATNEARRDAGCPDLRLDPRLTAAARQHSVQMREERFYSHVDPSGHSPSDRAAASGYDAPVEENIGRGIFGGHAAVNNWMTRADTRARLTDCRFVAVGVGAESGLLSTWWTQLLGTR